MSSPLAGLESGDHSGAGQATSLTLLAKLRDNQPDAWGRLDRLYGPLVRLWSAKSGVRPADMDDVCQEVYRTVFEKLANFRRERSEDSFRGWLKGITRHIILAYFRQVKHQPRAEGGTDAYLRFQEVHDALPLDAEESSAEVAALHHRALELIRCEFPPIHLKAFALYAVEKWSAIDTGAELGMKPASVRQAKARILKRLRQELGDT